MGSDRRGPCTSARIAGARLFYFTDREVLRRLNWLREETRD